MLALEANNVLAALGLELLDDELSVDIDGSNCDLIVVPCKLIVVPIVVCVKKREKNKTI